MNIIDNLRIVERGEPITQQEWRAMTESRTFRLLLGRLDKMIETERKVCEETFDVDKWRRTQGALGALKTVRSLADIMDGELAATSAKGGKR
jgi:hypothetical protein